MAKKYSDDLMLIVVREYQEGSLSYRSLAKKHKIKSKSLVERWVKIYEKFGAEGLKSKKSKKSYSVQFKLDVLSFINRTGSSETETALQFGLINNPTIISSWKKAFREGGAEALESSKGRSSMPDKPKNSRNKQTEKDMTNEQKLKRENELLRLEVEYLKKLQAFQIDPEGYLEKHKQRYHSNSKKSSN